MNQIDVPFTRIFTMMRMERRLEGYNTLEVWQSKCYLLVCVICYSEPSLVFFINDIIHGVELSTTEVGNRFFAVSTSLTQATANSKKGLKQKGEEKKDKEKRKAQSETKCAFAIQTNSDRFKSRFSRDSRERVNSTAFRDQVTWKATAANAFCKYCKDYDCPLPSESASIFNSITSHLLDLVNNYQSVHADEGFIGAWRKKTGQEGQYLQATSFRSNEKNKKESLPDTRSEGSIVRFKYDDNERMVGIGENIEELREAWGTFISLV
ncbi:hypothetical protein K435DRAFT_798382 [Dendrothele bispora CBS 962.96]|uniref:Uncharacterized protein n=1 Tax=Dendrothele bispora (strain CBS 962.96) TaxID=1314807 RepID=A0A4S8LZC4_DENBC|nr:hypothetical protein K435DRAFT_798382 [Dendrothele bispora CBS 962.96]